MFPIGVISQQTIGFLPTDIANCVLWLDAANRGVTSLTWDDLSGNNNHFTSPASGQFPTFSGGEAYFNNAKYLNSPSNLMSAATTGGECFIRMRRYADNADAGNNSGWMKFGTNASPDYFTFNTAVYGGFGTNNRNLVGNPTANVATTATYNIQALPGSWKMFQNGVQQFSGSSFGMFWPTICRIGTSDTGTVNFQGYIKQFIVYTRVLTAGERTQVNDYLSAI
jgi:hypothetical protein